MNLLKWAAVGIILGVLIQVFTNQSYAAGVCIIGGIVVFVVWLIKEFLNV